MGDSSETQGTILIVDDNPTNLDLLTELLRHKNYMVRVALNGRDALASSRMKKPDLIMLDILLPDVDGYEVCLQLKADETVRDVPVIFISSLGEVVDKVKAFSVGGVDYVTKPFQVEEVLARIENQMKIPRLQNEMRIANSKLQELDQVKANFTAMLVHDLKSPLTVIKTTLEMLKMDEYVKNNYLGQLVEVSDHSLDKVIEMINDMLEIYRSDTRNISVDNELIETERLLMGCVEAARVSALSKKISIETRIEPRLANLIGNRSKLERVFNNLLSNAIKFTPADGRIRLEAHAKNGPEGPVHPPRLCIVISDNGMGIPKEDLPHLFDPYRQVNSARRNLGVGLGLAIVNRIVTAHGGTIEVSSQFGEGASFSVELPILVTP